MYIVALGGNAILTPKEKGTFRQQLLHVRETMLHLRFLFAKGKEVVITHGNGPQVGNLFEQQEAADLPRMPLFILARVSHLNVSLTQLVILVSEAHPESDSGQARMT